jgi:hypothetical protein
MVADTACKKLDFAIIGVQKGGTTSLHVYLQDHPRIYLPPDKEAEFFTPDSRYQMGWPRFVEQFMLNAPPDKLWGKVTPQYMLDPRVPQRMRELMPDIKLIAVLRHPIQRAVSQYKMCLRRERDHRPFDVVIDELLTPEALDKARAPIVNRMEDWRHLIAWGEYGRIIRLFLDHFPRGQLLVLFTDELDQQPAQTLDQILSFVGLEPGYRPASLGKHYHVGGAEYRFPWLARIMASHAYRQFWTKLPIRNAQALRRRFSFWLEIQNTKPQPDAVQVCESTRRRLLDHYRPDMALLSQLIGRPVPWPDLT